MNNEQISIEPEVMAIPKDTQEIVKDAISPIERDDLIELAEKSTSRIEAIKKIITTALKVTNHNDWVKQGFGDKTKPYLCASGAEKIANLFNVRITNIKAEKFIGHDDLGSYYFYVYSCTASLPNGHTIETEGTCSSRDQFFAKKGDEWKPQSEVDETNIRKAAHSNMIVRAITQLLGLRNLSWDELQQAGIDIGKIGVVEYRNGSVKTDYISEAQRTRLFAIQRASKVTEAQLRDYLGAEYGITSTKEIKKSDYDKIISWIENQGGKAK